MTKTAAIPQFPAMPKFDLDAMIAVQKANVETLVAAQKILFDLAQIVAKKQVEYVKESIARTESLFKSVDATKEPVAYADELKAAVEKALAEVKETVDLGIKAQSEVVDLFVKRASANFEELKAAAA